jgi:trk system potassium uptake protein TrkA
MLGCGVLGSHLAASLASSGHRITIMDSSADRLGSLSQESHVELLLSSDSIMDDLRGLRLTDVDLFVAASEDDCKNAMAAQIARHIFHVPDVICLITDPDRGRFYQDLGVNTVCPTSVTVDTIHDIVGDSGRGPGGR